MKQMTEKEQKAVAIIRDLLGIVDGWAEGTSNSDRTLINDRKNSARAFLADTEDTGEKCPECGLNDIYQRGNICPQCGFIEKTQYDIAGVSHLPPKESKEKGGPNDAVYARMNQANWRVMSRSRAEVNKYTEIISAGIPYPGRLKKKEDE